MSNKYFEDLGIPLGFKLWFAFCALMGIGMTTLIVWAVIKLVNHFTK